MGPYKQEQDGEVTRQGQGDDDFELDMEGETYSQLLRPLPGRGGVAGALANENGGSTTPKKCGPPEGSVALHRIGENLREAWSTVSGIVLNTGEGEGEKDIPASTPP